MRHIGVLTACLLFCLLLVGAAGAAAGDGIAAVENESVDVQSPSAVSIDSALTDADGEIEVVVRLTESERGGTVAGLQEHAARSQAPLNRVATRTPGVQVENQFWIANAALVRVDTDRVPVEALARIDGVERLHRNVEIEAVGGRDGGDVTAAATPTRGAPALSVPLLDSTWTPTLDAAETTVGTNGVDTTAGTDATETTAGTDATDTTYGLDQIRATEFWQQYDTQGEGVTVTVLDTGIDPDHPDINLTTWAEFDGSGNQVGSDPKDFDPGGHGTHTSGTVSGGAASGTQIGVAPGVELHHGAVLTDCSDGDCVGSFTQIIAGMQWAVENDVEVLSMSLGAGGYYSDFIDPVRNAEDAGTTLVTSIGNNGEETSGSPGNVYDAISVGAANDMRDIVSFSSGESINTDSAWGSAAPADWPEQYTVPSVSGPGAGVNSSVPGGGYGEKWGTSMAAPHVAGAAALVQSATDRRVSPGEIETALEETASKPADWEEPAWERDTRYGSGIIDVPEAMQLLADDLLATFDVTPAEPEPGDEITFDASASTGNITEYRWDFQSDGQTDATGATVTRTFGEGVYDVRLTVTNATGANDTLTQRLKVNDAFVAERWSAETGNSVWSSPTVVNETVFVGSNDGNVSALNATSGERLWRVQTGDNVESSPTVVDGTVFVGSSDDSVYALNATTGEQRWRVQTGGQVTASPTVADGTVYVGSWDGNISALNVATGTEEWQFQTGGAVKSSATVVNGTVFVGSYDSNVYALDAATGTQEWQFQTGNSVYSSPTVATVAGTDTVFVGSFDSNVYAINATDGTEEWTYGTGSRVWSSPTVHNETVFVGSDDENLYALDAADGAWQWSFNTDGFVGSSPTVVNGTVFVGSFDNTVYAVNETVGTQEWEFQTGSAVYLSSPTVVDGTVFIGSNDDSVYALDTRVVGSSEGSRVQQGTLGHTGDWADQAPTALFTTTPSEPVTDRTVTFNASNTTGDVVEYRWDFDGDGAVETTTADPVTTHTYSQSGSTTVNLTVEDAAGETDQTTTNFVVRESPVAAVTVDPAEPEAGESVTFDASESGVNIVEYRWDFDGDGTVETNTTDPVTTHTYSQPGNVTANLTVVDDADETDRVSREIVVRERLVAAFERAPASPETGESVTFDAANATGTVVEYRWDFDGDGTVETNTTDPVVNHTYGTAGEFDATLAVVDSEGDTNATNRTVTVSLPPVVGDSAPRDPDGDGLYEDIRGDDEFAVFDVQTLFTNLDSPAVQDNAGAFNFQGQNANEVTIFDVQKLFGSL